VIPGLASWNRRKNASLTALHYRALLPGILMVACAAASWGTWSLFLRPTGLPPTITTPIMFAVMTLVALPLARRDRAPTWDREAIVCLLLNAAFDGLTVVTFFGAIRITTVAIAVLTHYLAPIIIALLAERVDGIRTPGARPAAALALAGLALILEPWHAPAEGALAGALLGTVSAFCYAGNVFVVRRLAAKVGSARQVAYHSAIALVVLLPFAVSGLATVSPDDLALVAGGSVAVGAIAGIVFVEGLQRIGSARAAVLTFAEPLVAVAVGAIAWGEPLRPLAAIGGALVLAAGIHVARQAR
jgi:drug/metabolite transporter (DMT)-like permease